MKLDYHSPDWAEQLHSKLAPQSPQEDFCCVWPVGTLIVSKKTGRRGTVASRSTTGAVGIQFRSHPFNYWITTWDVIHRNYTKA